MSTVSSVGVTESGPTKQVATYQVVESTVTKQLERAVLNDSSGNEIVVAAPGQQPVAQATTVVPPSDQSFSVVDGGSGLSSSWGIGGSPINSADMSLGVMVTDVPTVNQKIVVDDIVVSIGATAMSITLKEETSGTTLFGPWYCPANSGPIQITLRGKKKLATANKRIQCFASVAGNVTVQIGYHSEA